MISTVVGRMGVPGVPQKHTKELISSASEKLETFLPIRGILPLLPPVDRVALKLLAHQKIKSKFANRVTLGQR